MPQLVCLPGLLCTPGIFDPVLAALGRGRAVEVPPLDSFEAMVDHLAAGLTEPAVLMGMSMGSYLALALAQRVPEQVAGLILIGTNAAADTPKGAALRGKVAAWAAREGMAALAETIADTMLAQARRDDPALRGAIRDMAEIPGGIVGAGTLITPRDVRAAKQAGATFGVSPGATPALLKAAKDEDLPLLPGAATASEAMALLALGYDMLKFFPAEAAGGAAYLRAIRGPLPEISFCPTGGINAANAPDYLALANVVTVGGSWVAPENLIARGDWGGITSLARNALRLGMHR